MELKKQPAQIQSTLDCYFKQKEVTQHQPNKGDFRRLRGSFLWDWLDTQATGTRSETLLRQQWKLGIISNPPQEIWRPPTTRRLKINDLALWPDSRLLLASSHGLYVRSPEDGSVSDLWSTVDVEYVNLVSILSSNCCVFTSQFENYIYILGGESYVSVNGRASPYHRSESPGYRDLKTHGMHNVFVAGNDGEIFHFDLFARSSPLLRFKTNKESSKSSSFLRDMSLQVLLDEHLVLASTSLLTMMFWDIRMAKNSVVPLLQTDNYAPEIRTLLGLPETGKSAMSSWLSGTSLDPHNPSRLVFVGRIQGLGSLAGVLDLRSATVGQIRILDQEGKGLGCTRLRSSWCSTKGTFAMSNQNDELCLVNLDSWSSPESSAKQEIVKFPLDGSLSSSVHCPRTGQLYCGTTEGVIYQTNC